MQRLKDKAVSFLRKYGMDAESVDLEANCRTFIGEMENGLKGSGSLLMIPTYIGMDGEIPLDEPVIAIDAGGTNFRVAVIHFDKDRKPVIEDFNNYPMPGSRGEISKEEFFSTMADYIRPVLGRCSKISFCFSYPAEIMPDRDGRIIKFSKEIKARDVKGELLGKNLLDMFKKRGLPSDKSIIVLNDTVATLLAGRAASPGRIFDGYIGFILGTGTNICYAEKCGNIVKVPELAAKEGSVLINMESGGYDKVPRGRIDEEFDSTTLNPGDFIFEKTISGAYQGGLTLAVVKKAAQDGLFSAGFTEEIRKVSELAAKEIDDFLYYPNGENVLARCCSKGSSEDGVLLYYIIDDLFERIARFVTFSLTAVMEKTGNGRNPLKPVCITADGSTFYKSKLFRSKLDHYIKAYTNDVKGIYCEFMKVDNGTLVGTAIAGLLN
ncbi:MAG: hexokinase [Clostridiaceae bacterium]|jgi:hexokinase|nr:hexokinase [Clostridiaceae bacterium]